MEYQLPTYSIGSGGGKKKKKKQTTKKPVEQKTNSYETQVKDEIGKIQERRNEIDSKATEMKRGKGFFGRVGVNLQATAARVNLNRQQKQREDYLKRGRQIEAIKQRTELEKQKNALAKAKSERLKNVNFLKEEDIFGSIF